MIKVFNDRLGKSFEVEATSIKEIIEKLDINLEEFIVIRNNELITEDTTISDGDEIKFLSVISGG